MAKRCCAKMCYNSQTNNKNVYYFGLPKNEYIAHKWAIAANRQDLLEKPLNNLIKYYLCSAHFTNDCFWDQPRNSILRKTSKRPVNLPIPTIFESNINQYIPKVPLLVEETKRKQNFNENCQPKKSKNFIKKHNNYEIIEEYIITNIDNITDDNIDSLKTVPFPTVFPSDINNTDIELSESNIRDIESINENEGSSEVLPLPNIYESNINQYNLKLPIVDQTIRDNSNNNSNQLNNFKRTGVQLNDLDQYYHIEKIKVDDNIDLISKDENENSEITTIVTDYVCRLCAFSYHEDKILPIFSDEELEKSVHKLMPNTISKDDGLPQQICCYCFEKIKECLDILNTFYSAQIKLKENL